MDNLDTNLIPFYREKIACVDFDGTLIPWGPIFQSPRVVPGAIDAMVALKGAGYYIYILTSRMSHRYNLSTYKKLGFGSPLLATAAQMDFVSNTLSEFGVPFDEIGAEKVPADVYFDDKAIEITEEYPLPAAIWDFLGRTNRA